MHSMKKEQYERTELEIIKITAQDIFTDSDHSPDDEYELEKG